jgi:hypothetical protein
MNIHTESDACFASSVVASLYPDRILKSHFPGKLGVEDLTRYEKKRFKRICEDPKTYDPLFYELEQEN